MGRLRIMGVHGLGDKRHSGWATKWEDTVRESFAAFPDVDLDFEFVTYDPIFEQVEISSAEALTATFKLMRSGGGRGGG